MDISETNSRKPSIAHLSISTRRFSPACLPSNQIYSEMSLAVLVAHCTRELNRFRRGEPCMEEYSVELNRRAVAGDQEARTCMQRCFRRFVLDWLLCHPHRAAVSGLKSEDFYMAQAFERFWQATASNQRVECTTFAGILHSLHVCLQGVILDALRTSERPQEMSFTKKKEPRETCLENMTSNSEAWEMLQSMLVDRREHRLAYLLFHCGLKPREIVRLCPLEWSDVHEIYRLRYTLMQQLLNLTDHLS
jgi:hypothetical protein